MKQALHIFRKDARELWPEILVSLAIASALLAVLPMQWNGPQDVGWGASNTRMMTLMMLARGLEALLVISWAALVVRAVQADGTVGDRQFWVTKPYSWPQLLCAKAMFVAAFIVLPLLVLQVGVLLRAGFNPLASAAGLAFGLLLIVAMLLLPLMAIAAVTSNFTRTALTLLGVLAGVAALVAVVTMHLSIAAQGPFLLRLMFLAMGDPFLPSIDNISRGHHSQLPIALLLIAFCAAAIVLQYAWRRVWISRGVLLALPAALTAAVLITAHGSGPSRPFSDPVFAATAQGSAPPVQLTYAPDDKRPLYVSNSPGPVGIRIPLNVAGIAADSAVIAGAYPRIDFTGADGFTWSANVNEFYPEKFLPGSGRTHAGLFIPRNVYDRLKQGPVTVRLTFALVQLHAVNTIHIAMPDRDTLVPGIGVCTRTNVNAGLIACRSALREPRLTYASADWSTAPCPAGQHPLQEVRGDSWTGILDADPAEFGISPVVSNAFGLMSDWNNATGGKYLCSGSPITLTQYELVARTQSTLTISRLALPGN